MKQDKVYLHHILEAVAQIEEYVAGVSEEAFFRERLIQDAVVRQLEVVGEASRRLSEDFRMRQDQVPWHAIIGMRNRIAHDYLNVDLQIVWEVVQNDLSVLKKEISDLLARSSD